MQKNSILRNFFRFHSLIISTVLLLCLLSIPLLIPSNQHRTETQSKKLNELSFPTGVAPSIDGVAVNGPALTLPPGVSIIVDPSEPLAIQQAAKDLQRDLEKVLGQPSPIITTVPYPPVPAIVIAYKATRTLPFSDPTLTGVENHQVSVKTIVTTPYAVLQGSDVRGTLYAIYTFSDKFLNIPPLWYWSNWQAPHLTSVTIPANQGIRVGTPQTKYRAWFLNNQDLWGDWNPTPSKYAILFETMLRLKLNTYYVGSNLGEYSDNVYQNQTKLATDRGLIIAANDLATFANWDKYWTEKRGLTTVPTLSLANKAKYEDYWKYSLQFAKDKGLDVLWVLGFRGRGDGGFWEDIADAPTADTARGDVIEDQTKRQAALVRSTLVLDHPKMAFLVWNELSDLMQNNALQPPADSDLIWQFGNDVRDHYPTTPARTYALPSNQPYGLYMNLQFYSTGAHLTEAEGPWKTWKNFSIMQSRRPSGGLDFAYLNVGNLREFLLTGAAGAEMFWNVQNYNPDTNFQQLLSRYFGSANGAQLLSYYKSYLASFWTQHGSTISGFDRQYVFQDLRTKYAAQKQLSLIRSRSNVLNFDTSHLLSIDYGFTGQNTEVGAIMKGSQDSQSKYTTLLSSLESYSPMLPAAMRPFFTDTFIVPTQFLKEANKMLYNITRAYYTLSDTATASCYLQTARQAIAPMKAALDRGDHDQFSTWYNADDLFGITALENDISTTQTTLPPCNTITPTPTTSVPTPTPTKLPTPTPTKTSLIVTNQPYSSPSGLSTSSVKDAKRTLIKAKTDITLTQIACYSCGTNSSVVLYASDSSGSIGTKLFSGSTTTTSSSWSTASLSSIALTPGNYYVVEFVPNTFPVYYGSSPVSTVDIDFLKYSTLNAPALKNGAWDIRLTYSK